MGQQQESQWPREGDSMPHTPALAGQWAALLGPNHSCRLSGLTLADSGLATGSVLH